jgi:chromatin modification-related protein VID21
VERRRENRHLAIIDGMRKLARKRESIAHKQAECKSINVLSHILGTANTRVAQKAAQLRKAHEPAPPKSNVHTPQEFSRLKWEREEKMKQKMQMQQELNMRVRSTCEPLIT